MKIKERFSLTMHPDVMEKVDAYANVVGISRSSAISVLVVSALQQDEFLQRFPDFIKAVEMQHEKE